MKPQKALTITLYLFIGLFFSSCNQIFTTPLATPLARDSVKISKNTKTADLLKLAQAEALMDPEIGKQVLDLLASKSTSEITNLSKDDKTKILNLATSTTIKISDLTAIANKASSGGNENLISDALNAFDSSVNLAVVTTILSDPQSRDETPADTLVLATVALAVNLVNDIGTDELQDILEDDSASISSFSQEQQDKIILIRDIKASLNARPEEELDTVNFGGFKLTDLLGGLN